MQLDELEEPLFQKLGCKLVFVIGIDISMKIHDILWTCRV
jgi:hypothetical protein